MLTPTPFDPGLLICVLALLVVGGLALAMGTFLVPASIASDDWLARLAARLVSGLVFLAGIASIICLHRLSYVVVMPLIQLLFVVVARRNQRTVVDVPSPMERSGWYHLGILVVSCVAFEWWQLGWQNLDGSIRVIHYDLGYYVQMIRGILASHVADGWSATLGAHAAESELSGDGWYHWSPIWLAGAITALTGMSPMASLLHVVPILMDVALVIAAGAIVRQLTRMSVGKSLLVGAASLVAVQVTRTFAQHLLGLSPDADSIQHSRMSLAYAFAYKFEGMILLLACLSWLRKQSIFALMILACAAVSAPHSLAVVGVMAGVLVTVGLALRKRAVWMPAIAIIALLLSVWATLHWVLGVGLAKASGESLADFNLEILSRGFGLGIVDACTALVIGAISLPGILYLIFARDERLSEESRTLGWMALSVVFGSSIAYRLFSTMADNFHFVVMAQAVLVIPAGIWGLACMASTAKPLFKWAGLSLMIVSTVMGVADLRTFYADYQEVPWQRGELEPLKALLNGRPFGYFAKTDRPWWLPRHSSLAALLDTRCVRLHSFASEQQGTNGVTRYYGASRPFELVPPVAGETEAEWSLRFAKEIEVNFLIELKGSPIPPAIKAKAREVMTVPLITLYELLPDAPK